MDTLTLAASREDSRSSSQHSIAAHDKPFEEQLSASLSMDFSAFTTLAATRQDAKCSPNTKISRTTDLAERPSSRRIASSMYSRSVNHETSSTYWSAEAPSEGPDCLASSSAELHDIDNDDFREEHEEINAMMKDLAFDETTGEGPTPEDERQLSDESDKDEVSQIPTTPKSNNKPQRQRDLSDRTLVDALRTDSATSELVKAIVRVCWVDDLQARLVAVAIFIHKDLRSCFHVQVFTHDVARRAAEITTSIEEVLNIWMGHMLQLQKSIESLNVEKDTPNLMEMPKEEHFPAMTVFSKMLLPIPTQLGAECNLNIVNLMWKLFDNEVHKPFKKLLQAQRMASPAEATARGYLVVLHESFIKVDRVAARLQESTNAAWLHWKSMSEKIAQQAALMKSHAPAALSFRAKGAMTRLLHTGLSRSHTKKNRIPRTRDGRIDISAPITDSRLQPREASVRDTMIDIPRHPLDIASEPTTTLEDLMRASGHLLRNKNTEGCEEEPGPFTPHTQFSPRNLTNSHPGQSKVHGEILSFTQSTSTESSSSSPQKNHNGSMEDDPFTHWDSVADNRVDNLEYNDHNLNAPFADRRRLQDHTRGGRPVSSPYEWSLPSEVVGRSDSQSSTLIDGIRYYDMLKDFYRLDPEKPDPEEDPELFSLWYRARALRRLEEGGPPADPPEIMAPTEAMYAIQRAYDNKHKQNQIEFKREREELAREHARLNELDTQLRTVVAEQRMGLGAAGREKMALRESMSIPSPGYYGQQDLFKSFGGDAKDLNGQQASSRGAAGRRETTGREESLLEHESVAVFPNHQQKEEPQGANSSHSSTNSLQSSFVFPPRNRASGENSDYGDSYTGPIGHGQMELQERGTSGLSWYRNHDHAEYYATDEEEPWRFGEGAD